MSILIKNALIVNEGIITSKDIFIKNDRIEKIENSISNINENHKEIDASDKYLLPGIIDDQVHFREPGLTHKGTIYTEAKSGVAGGVTTFMEMPNTKPAALTRHLLADKYEIARQHSLANYSFFMGTSNDNYEEIMQTDFTKVCGLKIFMGSSTGNLLVDDEHVLSKLFANVPALIATHCEDEETIKNNLAIAKEKYGELIPVSQHPIIRNTEACYLSSSKAKALAEKHNTRLHILHISTEKECSLFRNDIPLNQKRITAEACIHHLWFNDASYETKGNFIKWNPAIKTENDRQAIWKALLDDRIDIIATDHAPHTFEEKNNLNYTDIPSGGPLLQHTLQAMLQFYHQGKISLERIVEKMCHAPAICFQVKDRGFIREGYFADLCLVDIHKNMQINSSNILSKCGWSPFENETMKGVITHTIINGNLVYDNGVFDESSRGMRIEFNR
jgi:dihydroorotase